MLVVCVAIQIVLWEPWEEPRDRRRTIAALQRVTDRLAKELSNVDRASWSGVYRLDSDITMKLTIGPDSGWILEEIEGLGGCLVFTRTSFGRCSLRDNTVHLIPWLNDAYTPLPDKVQLDNSSGVWRLEAQRRDQVTHWSRVESESSEPEWDTTSY